MYPKVSKFAEIDEQKVICLGKNKNNLRFIIMKNVNKFAFGQHAWGLRQGILWCVKQDAKISSTTFSVGHTTKTTTTDHYHRRQFHLTIPSFSKRQISRKVLKSITTNKGLRIFNLAAVFSKYFKCCFRRLWHMMRRIARARFPARLKFTDVLYNHVLH